MGQRREGPQVQLRDQAVELARLAVRQRDKRQQRFAVQDRRAFVRHDFAFPLTLRGPLDRTMYFVSCRAGRSRRTARTLRTATGGQHAPSRVSTPICASSQAASTSFRALRPRPQMRVH